MPLERKILLSILVFLIVLFSGYLIYDSFYPKYRDAQTKIEQYKMLIKRGSSKKSKISDEEIKELEELISYYKERFFTEEESLVTNTTPYIKKLLENSGVKISQYQGSKESVRFTISGNKMSLLNFLYRLSKENKMYHFPLFNLRMIDNNSFQGNIEVGRPQLSEEPNTKYYKADIGIKRELLPYYRSALTPLGTGFYTPKPVKVQQQVVEQPVVIPNKYLDKFTYVGLLKNKDEVITMFKEKSNGRVYRFKAGQTISDWTYIGEEDNKFIFKKDDITYEVRQ